MAQSQSSFHNQVFKVAFPLVIFQYLKNHLIKIVYLPHNGIIIEIYKCWKNKNGQVYRNQDTGGSFFKLL